MFMLMSAQKEAQTSPDLSHTQAGTSLAALAFVLVFVVGGSHGVRVRLPPWGGWDALPHDWEQC